MVKPQPVFSNSGKLVGLIEEIKQLFSDVSGVLSVNERKSQMTDTKKKNLIIHPPECGESFLTHIIIKTTSFEN